MRGNTFERTFFLDADMVRFSMDQDCNTISGIFSVALRIIQKLPCYAFIVYSAYREVSEVVGMAPT